MAGIPWGETLRFSGNRAAWVFGPVFPMNPGIQKGCPSSTHNHAPAPQLTHMKNFNTEKPPARAARALKRPRIANEPQDTVFKDRQERLPLSVIRG
jgi:hypothetical protein